MVKTYKNWKLIVLLLTVYFSGCSNMFNILDESSFNRLHTFRQVGIYFEDTVAYSFEHTISPFTMGKYEVTYQLWYTVYSWAVAHGYSFANPGAEGHDGVPGADPTGAQYEPVTTINWRDTIIWCNAYSEMSGFNPVYYTDAGFSTLLKISTGNTPIDPSLGSEDHPFVDWSANGYRLPTEGEWQFAGSYLDGINWLPYNHASGDVSGYCWPIDGGESTVFEDFGWFYDNNSQESKPVGMKKANQLGLYDMSGNVYEWCWDWHGAYPAGPETDYKGADIGGVTSGVGHQLRGGGGIYSSDTSEYLQVGIRWQSGPNVTWDGLGFRVARRL